MNKNRFLIIIQLGRNSYANICIVIYDLRHMSASAPSSVNFSVLHGHAKDPGGPGDATARCECKIYKEYILFASKCKMKIKGKEKKLTPDKFIVCIST